MVNAKVKSRQFCSVCKEWLEMEVVSTNDGDDDDGVIWFRCPSCQGFLPKLSGSDLKEESPSSDPSPDSFSDGDEGSSVANEEAPDESSMPWDSPADMMAAIKDKQEGEANQENQDDQADQADQEKPTDADPDDILLGGPAITELPDLDMVVRGRPQDLVEMLPVDPTAVTDDEAGGEESPPESADSTSDEPLLEYAALLAEKDPTEAVPYRPWGTYTVGQCIHHLAWDDCGVVVAKEDLPGGRKVVKVYFEEAGVVRLIEEAPR